MNQCWADIANILLCDLLYGERWRWFTIVKWQRDGGTDEGRDFRERWEVSGTMNSVVHLHVLLWEDGHKTYSTCHIALSYTLVTYIYEWHFSFPGRRTSNSTEGKEQHVGKPPKDDENCVKTCIIHSLFHKFFSLILLLYLLSVTSVTLPPYEPNVPEPTTRADFMKCKLYIKDTPRNSQLIAKQY